MRGQKKYKPLSICVYGDSGSGEHRGVKGCFHDHIRGYLSTEGTKQSLTDNNVDGRIAYRRDGSGRGDTPSTAMMVVTPSEAPTTNGIDGGNKYHCKGSQHSDSDY